MTMPSNQSSGQSPLAHVEAYIPAKNDERTRFVSVLEIPPAVYSETAVRVQIIYDAKQAEEAAIVAEAKRG
jgi:hypothetical protein